MKTLLLQYTINPNILFWPGEELKIALASKKSTDFIFIGFDENKIMLLENIFNANHRDKNYSPDTVEFLEIIQFLKAIYFLIDKNEYAHSLAQSELWSGLRLIDYFNLKKTKKKVVVKQKSMGENKIKTIDHLFSENEIGCLANWFKMSPFKKLDIDDLKVSYSTHWVHAFKNIAQHIAFIPTFNKINAVITGSYTYPLQLTEVKAYATCYGDFATYHQDSIFDNSITAVIFFHKTWELDWGGELIICDALNEPRTAVFPLPGRITVFDGILLHRAGVPTRVCHETRNALIFRYTHTHNK